jgi:hypothetical protein
MSLIPGAVIGRKRRAEAMTTWRKAYDALDRATDGNNHGRIIKAAQAEQDAWEEYADACADLNECVEFGCHNYSPDHVNCEKHRAR